MTRRKLSERRGAARTYKNSILRRVLAKRCRIGSTQRSACLHIHACLPPCHLYPATASRFAYCGFVSFRCAYLSLWILHARTHAAFASARMPAISHTCIACCYVNTTCIPGLRHLCLPHAASHTPPFLCLLLVQLHFTASACSFPASVPPSPPFCCRLHLSRPCAQAYPFSALASSMPSMPWFCSDISLVLCFLYLCPPSLLGSLYLIYLLCTISISQPLMQFYAIHITKHLQHLTTFCLMPATIPFGCYIHFYFSFSILYLILNTH